jgi:hypothetical protein
MKLTCVESISLKIDTTEEKIKYLECKEECILQIPNLEISITTDFLDRKWEIHLFSVSTLYLFHLNEKEIYRVRVQVTVNGNGFAEVAYKRRDSFHFTIICNYKVLGLRLQIMSIHQIIMPGSISRWKCSKKTR